MNGRKRVVWFRIGSFCGGESVKAEEEGDETREGGTYGISLALFEFPLEKLDIEVSDRSPVIVQDTTSEGAKTGKGRDRRGMKGNERYRETISACAIWV